MPTATITYPLTDFLPPDCSCRLEDRVAEARDKGLDVGDVIAKMDARSDRVDAQMAAVLDRVPEQARAAAMDRRSEQFSAQVARLAEKLAAARARAGGPPDDAGPADSPGGGRGRP